MPLVDTPLGTTPTTPRSPASRVGGAGYFELAVLPQPGVARIHPRGGTSEWGWGPTSVARTAFAVCFSESCALFLLVMCQAYDVMHAKSRYYNWRFSLITLVTLVLVIIPVLQCLFVAYKPNQSTYIMMLLRIPVIGSNAGSGAYFSPTRVHGLNFGTKLSRADLLTSALARLSVLGTVVLGALSGFGAIATAWMFADALGKKRWWVVV
ncbi:hypothetical protein FRC09_000634 [Ceratobasidium sp. 395]|nr:hypothetical protein FRC09_000634 [Ceratobasidium sp. 395]